MYQRFLQFIQKNDLFDPNEPILLAVSGGLDSMVMLHLFMSSHFSFEVAHANFHLRGDESDRDEKMLIDFCEKNQLKLHRKSFSTKKIAADHGKSIEMTARDLRYQWFKEILSSGKLKKIATAHHINDALETTIFNLIKGTGIAGIRSIQAKHENVVRPLIFAKREEIKDYALRNKITWREDKSNQSTDISRNFIRHEIIPRLRTINPSIENAYKTSKRRFEAADFFYQQHMDLIKEKYISNEGDHIFIDKQILKEPFAEICLFEMISNFGFSLDQVKDIAECTNVGAVFYSSEYDLNIDRENLIVSPKSEGNIFIKVDTTGQVRITEKNCLDLSVHNRPSDLKCPPNIALVDLNEVTFPLIIRSWKQGDYFYPLGMDHKKKISDFMIDEKIPLNLKRQVLVIESAGEILWVVNHRPDHRYRVKSTTEKVLKLVYNNVQSF